MSRKHQLPPQPKMKPVDAGVQAKFQQGLVLHQSGKLAEAERLYKEVLRQVPTHSDALHVLGVLALQSGKARRGVELIKRAIGLNPGTAAAHSNLGRALNELKRPGEALASCDKAIALEPGLAEAHNNRGYALSALKRLNEALSSYERAIALKPDFAIAHYNRGIALMDLSRAEEALASYDAAIALSADYAEAYNNRGNALRQLRRHSEALASYDSAIAFNPDDAAAHTNRGDILMDLKRPDEALSSYERAIAVNADHDFLYGSWLHAKMRACEWSDLEDQIRRLVKKIERSDRASPPFSFLALSDSLALQRKAAESLTAARFPPSDALPAITKRPRRDKIRIGYFSADFREHPVAALAVELFEKHVRSRFDVIAFSLGPETNDDMRRRLRKAFDKFIDVQAQSDRDVAMLARALEIDIAVDLGGYTAGNRTNIFAMRAAPIQASYLGYPGTMAAEYFDYLIADAILIPEAHRRHFSEKIVYLPDTYQANDSKRPISGMTLTRDADGLPRDGFVFCCFNNSHKITPEVFDCWMRVLKGVDGSVLWLLEDSAQASHNLRHEAELRGVNAERLVFAKRVAYAEHLARQPLADLFLDTLPYNAHTTASDALWTGVPVLTCMGNAFAGRVAASLLNAIGLAELVTSTPQAYEALAIELATHPAKLGEIRRKLAANRLTTPLFNTEPFVGHVEAAYTSMYERYCAGLPPDHIHVPR